MPLGWVGFDGGLKPAISFARGPSKRIEDEPRYIPPVQCPTAEGSTVDLANSGFTSCGCFLSPVDGFYYAVLSYTPTGTTLPIITPGTSSFVATIGTISVQKYTAAGCGTPDGAPFNVDVKGFASCEAGDWFRTIAAPGSVLPSGGLAYSATGPADSPVANELSCADGLAWTMDSTTLTVP